MTPLKVYNSLESQSKEIEMAEIPDKEFNSLIEKMINDLISIQMNEGSQFKS
jgi:hypothetical protein